MNKSSYLSSIEIVFNEVLTYATSADSFSYKSWSQELLKWKEVLHESCRELYDHNNTTGYELVKKNTKSTNFRLQKELKSNCSLTIKNFGVGKILQAYEEIVKEIDNLNDLYTEDFYIILSMTLRRFLNWINSNEFDEFHELRCVVDALKNISSLTNKQYGYIFYIMREVKSKSNVINLIKKYNIKGRAVDVKKNNRFYRDILEASGELEELNKCVRNNALKPDEAKMPGKSKSVFRESLEEVLKYFMKNKELTGIEKTTKFLKVLDS